VGLAACTYTNRRINLNVPAETDILKQCREDGLGDMSKWLLHVGIAFLGKSECGLRVTSRNEKPRPVRQNWAGSIARCNKGV
jgi:hypothetical protein